MKEVTADFWPGIKNCRPVRDIQTRLCFGWNGFVFHFSYINGEEREKVVLTASFLLWLSLQHNKNKIFSFGFGFRSLENDFGLSSDLSQKEEFFYGFRSLKTLTPPPPPIIDI